MGLRNSPRNKGNSLDSMDSKSRTDLQKAVAVWTAEARLLLKERPLADTHVDRLVRNYEPASGVELGVEAFGMTLALLRRRISRLKLVLVIPLVDSEELVASPLLEQLQTQVDDTEPPSLYVMKREVSFAGDLSEEYILPLAVRGLGELGFLVCFYRARRPDSFASNHVWPFTRSIYVEHFCDLTPRWTPLPSDEAWPEFLHAAVPEPVRFD